MFWRVPQTLFGKLACESLPYAMQIALLKALCFRHKRTKLGFWNPSNYIRWLLLRRLSQFFSINCYAALDLGSGVGQPFNRLIVQNRQQSIKRSMDWTLDDSFFYAMLTGRRRDHTPLGQAGLEASDTGTEAVKPDPGCSWECHSMKVGAGDESSEYREVVQPPRLPFHWWSAQSAAHMLLLSDEIMSCCGASTNGVSIWDAVHSQPVDRWTLSGAGVQTP